MEKDNLRMPNLYIISGCNGAGKTTASFTILPEMLDCDEFVNADEIARGLSPLNPEKSAVEAGRLMLNRIKKLVKSKKDFAFETTLATRSFVQFVLDARKNGYHVTLLYFWLESVELATERVQQRVIEGGHNIPKDVIKRRYFRGVDNFFNRYSPICDYWMLLDNSKTTSQLIAEGGINQIDRIHDTGIFTQLKNQ